MDGDANYGIVCCANCAAIAENRGEDGRKERPSELAIDLAARLLNSKTFLQIRERSELREDAYVAIIFTRLIIGNLVPTFIRWHNSGFHRGRRLNKPLVTLTTRRKGKQECCDDYHVSLRSLFPLWLGLSFRRTRLLTRAHLVSSRLMALANTRALLRYTYIVALGRRAWVHTQE